MGYRALLAFILVLVLVGCASAPQQYAEPRIVVVNRSAMMLAAVKYQPCGSGGEEWVSFTMEAVAPGGLAVFSYPEGITCFNFRALSTQGKTLGVQVNVRAKAPFRWVLF